MAERKPNKPTASSGDNDAGAPPNDGKTRDMIEQELDAALADSFPASDPVAMVIPSRGDRRKKARVAATSSSNLVREVVAVFDRSDQLEAAIDDLQSSGFDRAEFSMLAVQETVEEKLGHAYKKVCELEDNPDVPRRAYVPRESVGEGKGALLGGLMYLGAIAATGAVVGTGGAIGAAIAAAAAGAGVGAFVGGILATVLDGYHANYLRDQLDRGGILLWVRVWDSEDEKAAVEILSKHSAHDVHAHTLPAS